MKKLKINKRILEEIQKIENSAVKDFLINIWSNELSHPIVSEIFRYKEDYSSLLDRLIGDD